MKKAKYFIIQELVPKEVYDEMGERAWTLIDERLIDSIDTCREEFGPLTINNWHIGGDRDQCGLRTDLNTGAKRSQHRYGRAADMISSKKTAQEMRDFILKNRNKFSFISAMEDGVSWLHIDVRNCDKITVFKP